MCFKSVRDKEAIISMERVQNKLLGFSGMITNFAV